MRSDMRTYWRDLGFWRWWWHNRITGPQKGTMALVLALALGVAGYVGASRLNRTEQSATLTTERVITIRKAGPKTPAKVVTVSEVVTSNGKTVTRPGATRLVTIRRNGRPVVVRVPGDTITATVRGPVRERVVTNARTATVTETTDRPTTVTGPATTQTVTAPGATQTITHEVTQPATTVTQTTTATDTTTETETVLETVTVTVTVRP